MRQNESYKHRIWIYLFLFCLHFVLSQAHPLSRTGVRVVVPTDSTGFEFCLYVVRSLSLFPHPKDHPFFEVLAHLLAGSGPQMAPQQIMRTEACLSISGQRSVKPIWKVQREDPHQNNRGMRRSIQEKCFRQTQLSSIGT